jgi:tRNA modification GTPase
MHLSKFATVMKNWDDTIVALASAPGLAAISLIRISGPRAFDVLDQLAPKAETSRRTSHKAFLCTICPNDEILDEALATIFKSPASFTGENSVEIGLHGSPYIVREVIKACIHSGCRLAAPGEFTQRAFLNGKLDLAQAEAVGDLIQSESKAAHRAALQQLKGRLSNEINELRQQLIDFAALVELELDFGEEDVAFADRRQLASLVAFLIKKLNEMLQSFSTGQAVKNGIPVVIAGPPNAGKSTLLNALLQEEKAIVSPVPGTTRDVIEDQLILEGILFRFVDTAGLRQTQDPIESMGIARTRQQLEKASFVLLLDAPDSDPVSVLELENEIRKKMLPYLKLFTKSDLRANQPEDGLCLSAADGSGLEELKSEIVRRCIDQQMLQSETALITNLRHFEALKATQNALHTVQTSLESSLSGDLLASDIREALYHLGSITGAVSVEEILGSIFSRFCIGK